MVEAYEMEHMERVRKLASECMVLLKSDGSFPLERAGKIALYGCGARRTLKGGRGSGDVYVRAYTTVEQGLLNAGFEITTKDWLASYEEAWKKARVAFRAWLKEKIATEGMGMLMENLSIVMPEPEYEIPLTGEGDVAVYVLSRLCGEGVDRQDVAGDFLLTETEIRDILYLQAHYPKFLLILNMACIVDLSPVAGAVSNILLLSQTGMTIGDSFADVLLGKAYPSGKLSATWAARQSYPAIGEFGNRDDTRYREGVYVGYRYFDSVGEKPLFAFGHGLGYTDFSLVVRKVELLGTEVAVSVQVKNIGKYKGKEVVQLYVNVPCGKIDQPWQTLAAFEKTKELSPDEETLVTLCCPLESLASTDVSRHVKLLEKGRYVLRVGNGSRNTACVGVVELLEDVVVQRLHAVGGETDFTDWKPNEAQRKAAAECMERCLGTRGAHDEAAAGCMERRPGTRGAHDEAAECVASCREACAQGETVLQISASAFTEVVCEMPMPGEKALALAKSLPDEELAYLCTGDYVGEGSKSVVGDAAITVVGAAGETTGRFKHLGVPNLVQSDGPSGLRISRLYGVDEKGIYPIKEENPLMEIENPMELLPEGMAKILTSMLPSLKEEERHGEVHEQNCTAIPVGTAMAQSWSVEVAKECADIVAEEMEHFGIHILLAPSLNIQRHPLCGRNFEYMSEDPLVSGKIAAAFTAGVQGHPGRTVTLKHFICNNQEANRFRTSSMVNERTLRDLYARGFEIAVKEAQPHCMMSSYNLLNGIHTSERRDLLETMLRGEWGYRGMVMSDYLGGEREKAGEKGKYRKFASAQSVKAGNDLMMPGGQAHYENILAALRGEDEECTLTRQEVETCAARNMELAWKVG